MNLIESFINWPCFAMDRLINLSIDQARESINLLSRQTPKPARAKQRSNVNPPRAETTHSPVGRGPEECQRPLCHVQGRCGGEGSEIVGRSWVGCTLILIEKRSFWKVEMLHRLSCLFWQHIGLLFSSIVCWYSFEFDWMWLKVNVAGWQNSVKFLHQIRSL